MKRSTSSMSLAVVMTVAALIMLSAVVQADALDVGPCTDDFAKYCSDVTPGGGRLIQCYEQNKNQMSADCMGWAETAKINADALKAACSEMMNARCSDVQGDPFAMLDCLQSNYIDLSMKCRERLNDFRSKYPKPVQ